MGHDVYIEPAELGRSIFHITILLRNNNHNAVIYVADPLPISFNRLQMYLMSTRDICSSTSKVSREREREDRERISAKNRAYATIFSPHSRLVHNSMIYIVRYFNTQPILMRAFVHLAALMRDTTLYRYPEAKGKNCESGVARKNHTREKEPDGKRKKKNSCEGLGQ